MTRWLIALALCGVFPARSPAADPSPEARYYDRLAGENVQCRLCPRACVLAPGQRGVCTVRLNDRGTLRATVYAQICSLNIDPIEKKPLFHFLPRTQTLSLAAPGCNLRCGFCQNWSISQAPPGEVRTRLLEPGGAVRVARERACPSISFTYSEPMAWFEYTLDTALRARSAGIRTVIVSCGYINTAPLDELCNSLDAASIDLKGFTDETYRTVAGGRLGPILEALKLLKDRGVWLEVGYLVIPTVNDSAHEVRAMARWTRAELGSDVPVHFLRFFPQHKMTNLPPTPMKTMEDAIAIARSEGLRFVYLGNVPGHPAEDTICPACGKTIIDRTGYSIIGFNVKDGKCGSCGAPIPGVWK